MHPLLCYKCDRKQTHLVTSKKNKEMTYSILTDTDFFRDLESGNTASIKADYGKFIEQTVCQCKKAISKVDMNIMLAYTETELMGYTEQKGETGAYAGKASHFLKEMQDMAEDIAKAGALPSQIEWTGTTTDLVELIYALKETGCVNNGEMLIGKMCEAMFLLFGKKPIKDCARLYVGIKEREDDLSRTYFIDKMRRKLNTKIKEDIRKSDSRR